MSIYPTRYAGPVPMFYTEDFGYSGTLTASEVHNKHNLSKERDLYPEIAVYSTYIPLISCYKSVYYV
jgi:hypothetical protein